MDLFPLDANLHELKSLLIPPQQQNNDSQNQYPEQLKDKENQALHQ